MPSARPDRVLVLPLMETQRDHLHMLRELLHKRNVLASSVDPGSLCEGEARVREVKGMRGTGEGKKDENIPG